MMRPANGIDVEHLLTDLYAAFNARDIDAVIERLHPDVDWPNGWEGGRVFGRAAVREYWMRQFAAIDPQVDPKGFTTDADGSIVVQVHAVIRDRDGRILNDHRLQHVYRIADSLIVRMDIR
jgi:ketosteroid isomerase-like protein